MKTTDPTALRRGGRESAPVRRGPRRTGEGSLQQLKGNLFRRLTAGSEHPVLRAALQRAAAEAESLAWLSPYPLLVLPLLLEEKAREARRYAARQAAFREASREWLTLSE